MGKKYWKIVILCVTVAAILLVFAVIRKHTGKKNIYWNESRNEFSSDLFGENTYIITPEDDPEQVNKLLEYLWNQQETNQFGENRYAVYFMPGDYDTSIKVKVGFYMQIAGLGKTPQATKIAALNCNARWLGDDSNHNACCNFWRGVENLEIASDTMWAVSQATFMRRTQVYGVLQLHDNYGWCSGGFLADTKVTKLIDSGSQQQWLTRNSSFPQWQNENWNMVFVGDEKGSDPTTTWPDHAYTSVATAPVTKEKPFLTYDKKQGFSVTVPACRKNASGLSWGKKQDSEEIPLSQFYIAKPQTDTSASLNKALTEGKNILFTPGIYKLSQPVQVNRENQILLGMGLATLKATNGNVCIETADGDGITVAGLLLEAGKEKSQQLMVVGKKNSSVSHSNNPILLADLFFRVGGTKENGRTKDCLVINSSQVIGDNFWIWRADHGDNVGWNVNTADHGLIVNGNDVTIYGLMVEHFQKYQTTWNGENGKVYLYQSELPYDVPKQSSWTSEKGKTDGYASFLVTKGVKEFQAWGLGIYAYNRDAVVNEEYAMKVPDAKKVKVHNICDVVLNGYPGISHVINNAGNMILNPGELSKVMEYETGEK